MLLKLWLDIHNAHTETLLGEVFQSDVLAFDIPVNKLDLLLIQKKMNVIIIIIIIISKFSNLIAHQQP